MGSSIHFFFIPLVFLSSLVVISASTAISDAIFQDHSAAGRRNILQAKQNCPINFENQDYKIITDQCKGPIYAPDACCPAFKQFACPFAEQLNDLSSNCATTMFSYINLAGKYPPGLFANECQEGKEGLLCDDAPSPSESANDNGSMTTRNPSLLILGVASVMLLLLGLA